MVKNDISAVLLCLGYGYKAKVLVNGTNIGITGGKSESKRLFAHDSSLVSKASSDQKKLFCLKEGKNKVVVEFTKTSKGGNNRLEILLAMEEYPAPLFFLHSVTKSSGKAEKIIDIHEKAPPNFKPVFVSDKEGKSVLVYVGSMDCTITPILNGQSGMTLAGMPGGIVMENVQFGKNELSLRYAGDAGAELKLTVITPEGIKMVVRKLKDSSEKIETFTFTAK